MPDTIETSEKVVGALSSGLAIVQYLSRNDAVIGVSALARELALNPSTCFNLLKTLVKEDLVEFDPKEKTYRSGYGLVALARGQLERSPLVGLARPHLEALAEIHSVTATLWLRMGKDRLILVDRADTGNTISVHMAIGRKIPLYIAALGRGIAGHMPIDRDELEKDFAQQRWQNPPSFAVYCEEIEEAKRNGFAIDQDNFWKGVTAVAAPIFNNQGVPAGGISTVGFTGQFNAKHLKALSADVRDRARVISRNTASP